MRILILEDDPLIGLDLQDIVETCGPHSVEMCMSLADLRASLATVQPDFAFLDIDLPDGKSFDLAARMDERRIPFAFLSGSRRADVPDSLKHVRFISKPYGEATIRTMLDHRPQIAC